MRCYLVLPIVSLAVLAAAMPAMAQSDADRTMYQPLQGEAIRQYQKEVKILEASRAKLAGETDLNRGCAVLRENVTQGKVVEKVLDELVLYATKLRQTKERKTAEANRTAVQEEMKLRQGDIDRLCASVSAPTT